MKPIFQVGKGGVNHNLITQVNDALEARELIKVNILQNCDDDKHDVADEITRKTNAHLVQLIGNTMVFYKESQNKKTIELP